MKKTILWILTALMMTSLLAGCRTQQREVPENESQTTSETQQTENIDLQEETLNLDDILKIIDEEFILPDDEFTEAAEAIETESQVTEDIVQPEESVAPSQPAETTVPETEAKENGTSGSTGSNELADDEF